MNKKKKKKRLRWTSAWELPAETLTGGVCLTLYEDLGCTVQNHGELITCTAEQVRVRTKIGVLCIDGESFQIEEMQEGRLSISGKIRKIGYEQTE